MTTENGHEEKQHLPTNLSSYQSHGSMIETFQMQSEARI